MRFGCCCNLDNEKVVEEEGYTYGELSVTGVLDERGEEDFLKIKEEVKNRAIKPEVFNGFFPGDLKLTGEENDLEKAKEYALLEGLELVKEVNRPEIKLLVDLFHFTEEEEPFDSITQSKEELVHVHIPVPDIKGVNPYPRRFLHNKFFQYLKRIDYQGRITVEDNGGRFNNFSKQASQILEYITKGTVKNKMKAL